MDNLPQDSSATLTPLVYLAIGAVIGFIIAGVFGFNILKSLPVTKKAQLSVSADEKNLPSFTQDTVLPVRWGDLGKQMTDSGVIDAQKLEKIYSQRGGLDEASKKLLYATDNGNLVINSKNASFLLNLLWALGLSNKNPILEQGPMQDKQYGGAGNFASTGGWTLANGKTMGHYSKYGFINLTSQQQALVEKVSKEIYRPCCDNSTYFPDCNHGMAMLGLLELMASQEKSEAEMYKVALIINSYWFPDTYKTIAKYMQNEGIAWQNVEPKKILGYDFSSSSGYNKISSQVQPVQGGSGGGCGV